MPSPRDVPINQGTITATNPAVLARAARAAAILARQEGRTTHAVNCDKVADLLEGHFGRLPDGTVVAPETVMVAMGHLKDIMHAIAAELQRRPRA